ncbi:TonB-dependent receptor [Novosphingobium pentaromativorans]|uniref:TonB-dependent receptor n=1 Tax=Novosphingobium pentaromativorans US6-1 TaxID=1088721 RepID=G6EG44_9SPHN|nr:TonB-dependent receptor [Novosphingobium pentaromativorans]EHJ59733.1 hypothetical protein NSU_3315 [Novosphingobium pentaromativorans US6-1]
MRNTTLKFRLLLTVAFAGLPTVAIAQASPVPGQSSADSEQVFGEGDIVVTANRREQSLRDVPLAISAFSQESLDQRQIRGVGDLSKITPGLTFAPGYGDTTQISIRGISSIVGAGTTGIYIDDTPLQVRALGAGTVSTNAYPALFDLARVEVLRGPQGTLFGAGSEGGTVRFITPEPGLSSYSVYSRAEVATTKNGDPSFEGGAAVGGPIIADRLGFRVSADYRRDGGWIDRVDRDTGAVLDNNANSVGTLGLRGALKAVVTDRLIVTPSIYYQRTSARDTNMYWRHLSDPSATDFNNGKALRQPTLDKYTLYSFAASYDLDSVLVISNTSYFDRVATKNQDFTEDVPYLLGEDWRAGYDNNALSDVSLKNSQKTFTQEFRLQSQGTGKLKWVAGLFYQSAKQTADQFVPEPNGDALFNALFGADVEGVLGLPLLQPGDLIYYGLDKSKDQQIAAFGQVDYKLTDKLSVTAGIRLAKTKFSSSNEQGGPFNGGMTTAAAKQSEKPVTPKFGLEYKPNADLLLYASAAKGYRIGGGNNPVPATTCQSDLNSLGLTAAPGSYGSDSVWSYEVGAKGSLADRLIRFETSAYYIDWTNIQSSVSLSCGFSFVANLGTAVSKGADAHITLAPATGLTLDVSAGYTDAHFTKDVQGAAGSSRPLVTKGDVLPVPEWTVSLALDYEHPISSGGASAYGHAEYNYNAGYDLSTPFTYSVDPDNNLVDSNNIVNFRAGIRAGSFDISAFVNNLTNSHPRTSISRPGQQDLFFETTIRPRTIGMNLTYRY